MLELVVMVARGTGLTGSRSRLHRENVSWSGLRAGANQRVFILTALLLSRDAFLDGAEQDCDSTMDGKCI